MDSIIEALVEAGYFRARISTLSDFDKIIGGIAWALQVFSYDVNINIFYADTLDLGQKIALTERLVMVILAMNCPHQIEPHQIVGLDYTNLLTLIRWLIKRSAEVRREHEAFNRLIALRHFHRVTNGSPDRSEWCHIVPVAHLKKLDSSTSNTSDDVAISGEVLPNSVSMNATSLLMDRLNEDFKCNQHVSFAKLPSLFRVSSNYGQRGPLKSQEDNDENSGGSSSDEDATETQEDQARDYRLLAEEEHDSNSCRQDTNTEVCLIVDNSKEQIELHKELDTELLATNQKILNLLKKLDSMPSQLEISQYQKRYIELHQQLISKNKDVKKLYALFNSLDSTKHYLIKEINLLDSILSNLDLTNNSAANRDQFLQQFQDIILKIQGVRDDVVSKLDIIRQKCDILNAEYVAILD